MTSFAGAVVFPESKKALLFKNRDLGSEVHKDELFYDVDCFGIKGVDMPSGKLKGLAIGVNRYGLIAGNTHVRQSEDSTYDVLTEQILMFAKDAKDGLSLVVDHLKSGKKYQWGNLILADKAGTIVIEIAGNEHSIEMSDRKVLRTGHHIILDTEEALMERISKSDDLYEDSVKRVERGYDLLRQVKNINSVFAMLKDHGEAPGQRSICRHATAGENLTTVMSYVVEVDYGPEARRPKVLFHFTRGKPCESSFTTIPLPFPADEEMMKRANLMYFK